MQAPTTRSRSQVRADRFEVMSAALTLFNTRKANTARRDKWSAERMRFAGTEAAFCIAEVKARLTYDAATASLQAAVDKSRADQIAAMTPEQLDDRIRAILNEIEGLPYRPLSVNIGKVGDKLRAELAELRAVTDRWSKEPQVNARRDLGMVLAQTAQG